MDIKQLLEKMTQFAGQAVGQKPGDQWRGTDKGTPGKKLVGGGDEQQEESVLKDLSKGATPKTKEQELAEEWATFSEENIGTHPKRVGRKSDRHSRGHEPKPRYTTVKADEAANPAQQAAIAIAMKQSGKKPKNEGAEQDPIVAKVVKQMRPGLKNLDMGNEAFLYFAYELGKQRARDAWEDYLPAIRAEYEKGLNEDANTDNKLAKLLTRFVNQSEGADRAVAADAIEYIRKLGHIEQFATSLDYFAVDLDEGLEESSYYGPVEARWMVKLSDDEGDHLKTYVDKFTSLSAAKKAYKNTPYATDFKYKPVKKDQVEEAVMGGGGVKDLNDYVKKRDYIYQQLADIKQKDNYPYFKQALFDLMRTARQKGIKIEESRAHDKLSTWFKDRERAQKFSSGELKIPTPQERQAQLAKQKEKKEKVDEYGANNPPQGTTIATPTAPQKVDPKQAQQVAQNLNVQKTALSQLKQLNPDINPQKAAMAATKDLATMNPQEKEVLAQVAKTLSPALGSPAFGSIKTALQKAKNT